jgi:hypothetical protein
LSGFGKDPFSGLPEADRNKVFSGKGLYYRGLQELQIFSKIFSLPFAAILRTLYFYLIAFSRIYQSSESLKGFMVLTGR